MCVCVELNDVDLYDPQPFCELSAQLHPAAKPIWVGSHSHRCQGHPEIGWKDPTIMVIPGELS